MTKDYKLRPSAKQLLDHEWLKKDPTDNKVSSEDINDTLQRIKEFSSATKFQKTIMSVFVGMMADQDDLKEVKEIFYELDVDQDGNLEGLDI